LILPGCFKKETIGGKEVVLEDKEVYRTLIIAGNHLFV